jgi:hypothetical protein
LRNLALLCPVAEVGPFLFGQTFPLDFGHASTAENQIPKFVYALILLFGVVISQVLIELGKESAPSICRK